jgi:5-hydroxyisourate hydrolase-like protein (transthyretin family)
VPVTIQVYDLVNGRAAVDARVRLEYEVEGRWRLASTACTDGSGRIGSWPSVEHGPHPARLVVDSRRFFASQGLASMSSEIAVPVGVVRPDITRHVSLQIAPYGFAAWTGVDG